MPDAKITPQQAEALARFLLTIRPDWSRFYTTEAVREMRHITDDLEAIVHAAVRGALSPKIAKPDVLAMNGEHWRADDPARHAARGNQIQVTGRCPQCWGMHAPDAPHSSPRTASTNGPAIARAILRGEDPDTVDRLTARPSPDAGVTDDEAPF